MPDYKKMYLTMVNATEQAMDMLIKAQQTCEELYIGKDKAAEAAAPDKTEESGSYEPLSLRNKGDRAAVSLHFYFLISPLAAAVR